VSTGSQGGEACIQPRPAIAGTGDVALIDRLGTNACSDERIVLQVMARLALRCRIGINELGNSPI
jgi:hypothetical protein